MGIQKILSVILALALISGVGAGYAAEEDRSLLNIFAWIDEFTDLCNDLGFNAAWAYEPGGGEENQYFTLYIKPYGGDRDYEFLVTFSQGYTSLPYTPSRMGSVLMYWVYDAKIAHTAEFFDQIYFICFALTYMMVVTEESELEKFDTIFAEAMNCITEMLDDGKSRYYSFKSESGIWLSITEYYSSQEGLCLVFHMQYSGWGNLPEPGPDGKVTFPQSTPQAGGQ